MEAAEPAHEDDITRTRSHSPISAHAHWYGAEVLHSAFEVPNNEKKNTKINLYCNRYESTITTAQKRAKIIQKESVPAKGEDMYIAKTRNSYVLFSSVQSIDK